MMPYDRMNLLKGMQDQFPDLFGLLSANLLDDVSKSTYKAVRPLIANCNESSLSR